MIFECNTDKMIIGDTIFFIISFFFRLEKHTEYRSVAQYFENRGIWGKVQGVRPPTPPVMTCGFLIQLVLVFCKKQSYVVYWSSSRARDKCTPPKKNSWIRPWLMTSTVIKPGSFLYACYICQWHRYQIRIILTSSRSQSMPLQELLILDSK